MSGFVWGLAGRMNILCITTTLPHRQKNGGEIATRSIVEGVERGGHNVTVLGYTREGDPQDAPANHRSVRVWPIESELAGWRRWSWLARALLTGAPYVCTKFRTRALVQAARGLCEEHRFDAVIIDHLQLGWLAATPFLPAYKIGVAHNLEHRILAAQAGLAGNGRIKRMTYARDARLMKRVEADLLRRLDQIWVLTEEERQGLAALAPDHADKLRIVPLPGQGFESAGALPEPTADVTILGSWLWDVNRKGLEWFMAEVAPRLPEGLRVLIGGKGTEHVPNTTRNVTYCGFVPDAADFLRQGKVICVPSAIGAGIQLKTIEGISIGRPLVTTQVGIRGIQPIPDYVTVTTGAEDMARALIGLANQAAVDRGHEGLAWAQARQATFDDSIAAALSRRD